MFILLLLSLRLRGRFHFIIERLCPIVCELAEKAMRLVIVVRVIDWPSPRSSSLEQLSIRSE